MNQFREWTGKCQRCLCDSEIHTMSMFDVALICMKCWEGEKKHPAYKKATTAEIASVRDGDLNFKGIGHPDKK